MMKNYAHARSEECLPFLKGEFGVLAGLPFIDCWRLHRKLTVQIFEFGRPRYYDIGPKETPSASTENGLKGDARNGAHVASQGPIALHVSCGWRLIKDTSIVVASGDHWHQNDYIGEHKMPGKTQLDRSAESLCEALKIQEIKVKDVSVTALGDIAIAMTHGYTLELFPMSTESGEYWRLMYMDGRNYSLVCERDQIYTIEDELIPPPS